MGKIAITPYGVEVTIDPNDKYPRTSVRQIQEAIGVLPFWIDPNDERPMREQFDSRYNFGIHEMRGGVLKQDGTYKYPGDPLMQPIAKATLRDETIWFFLHAMVGIYNEKTGDTFMTRMD